MHAARRGLPANRSRTIRSSWRPASSWQPASSSPRPSSRRPSWACGRSVAAACRASSSSGNFSVSFHGCGHQLAAGDRADVHLAVARHHRDVQAGAVEDRSERVEPLDPRADEVQRHRRTGDVGDHQVVDHRTGVGEAQRGHHPYGEAEGARGGELGPVLERVGRDRLVVVLGVGVALGDLGEPLQRVLDVGAEPGEDRGDLVAAALLLRLAAHRDRHRGDQRGRRAARRARRGSDAARHRTG